MFGVIIKTFEKGLFEEVCTKTEVLYLCDNRDKAEEIAENLDLESEERGEVVIFEKNNDVINLKKWKRLYE